MKESAPEIALDLFQNCDFPEELVKLLMQRQFEMTMSLVGLAKIPDCRPSLFSLEQEEY